MNVYAESSAVLGWLFGEPRGDAVRNVLADADTIIASDLTLIECDRILIRRRATGSLSDAAADRLRRRLTGTVERWTVLRIEREIVERARSPFPDEPIRTLDAIHLASAIVASTAVEDFGLLSLDDRVRSAARALGLRVVPT